MKTKNGDGQKATLVFLDWLRRVWYENLSNGHPAVYASPLAIYEIFSLPEYLTVREMSFVKMDFVGLVCAMRVYETDALADGLVEITDRDHSFSITLRLADDASYRSTVR